MAITAQMRTQVSQLYVALFMRAPDADGLGYWVSAVDGGKTIAKIAQEMYDTTNARPYYPLFMTDAEIVNAFYTNVLGRAPDTAGSAYWVAELGKTGATKGSVIADMIYSVQNYTGTDPLGTTSKALFNNKVVVAEYYAEKMLGGAAGAAAAISAVTATSNVIGTAAIEALIATGGGVTSAGQTFSLTANADVIPGLLGSAGTTSNAGDNSIYSTETTLSSGDNLNGGAGNDTLYYASSTSLVAVNESGFTTSSIENAVVTSDVPGLATTFDTTGMTGLARITNDNSAQNLTFVGGTALLGLSLTNVGAATRAASVADTTVTYNAATVAGTADKQALTLSNNKNVDGSAIGTVTVDKIEEFNVTTSVGASLLDGIASTTMKKMTVVGDQSLTLAKTVGVPGINFTDNAAVNVLDASGLTGTAALDVTIGTNTATLDVAVTGGAGNDRADFSTNFDAKDAFTGGAGRDTLALRQDIATGQTATTGGTVATVEILEITNGGTGTTNMNNFPGVDTVFYSGLTGGVALAAASTITNAVTGLTVQVNVDAVGQNSTATLKTNGTTDAINYVFNMVGAADNLGTVSAAEFETVNITTGDDTTVLGTGVLTIANLAVSAATKVTIAGNAELVIANTLDSDAATPVTSVIATIDAGAATAPVTFLGTNLAAAGATVTLGSGNDTFNLAIATANGSDTFDLSKGGNDKIVYTALAQSDPDMDVIKSFTTGDVVDVRAAGLLGNTLTGSLTAVNSSQFVGTKSSFGEAQGALIGSLLGGNTSSAVFDSSSSILWVDVDGNGTLDANDFRVKLDGVTTVVAADLGFTAGVTFTANQAAFNTATAPHSTENNAVGGENDTINARFDQLGGSTINGLGGTDVLNLSASVAPTEIADLRTIIAFTNVETVNLASTVEGVDMDAADLSATQVSKINGISGSNQSLTVNNGSNISAVALTNLPVLNMTGTVTMKAAQHNAFSTLNGGAGTIVLTTAGTVSGNATIAAYTLGGTTTNDFTVGAAAQNVTASAGADTIRIGGLTYTGTLAGLAAADTLVTTTGANLTGATGVATAALSMSGTVTLNQAQHQAFASITAAGGADTISILTAGAITAAAGVETYSVSSVASNNVTVNALTPNVNVTGAAGFATTVTIGGNTVAGTYALGNGADVIVATTGANIAGVNAGAVTTAEALTLTGGITMTVAQHTPLAAAITAAGVADSVTLTTSGTVGVASVNVEAYTLNGAAADTISFGLANAANGTTNGQASVALSLAGGGADVVTINNAAILAADAKIINVTGFAADDKIVSQVANTSIVTGAYTQADAGNKITGQVSGNVIEIHSLGLNGVSIASPLTDASLLTSLNAVLTGGGTVGDIANGSYTVVGYNGATAYVYQVSILGGDGTAGGDDLVELVGTITGLAADALNAVNLA